jgi:hypothetical protein
MSRQDAVCLTLTLLLPKVRKTLDTTPSAAASWGAEASPAAVPKPIASAPNPNISGGGFSLQPQISFSVPFSGVPSKDVGEALVSAIRSKESELTAYFEKMLTRIASNQRRLAYDQ